MYINPISFTVPSVPFAKQRPRFDSRNRHGYTPLKTKRYENLVGMQANLAMAGKAILEGPVSMTLIFAMPIPASWSEKKKALALEGKLLPTARPDLDNMLKAIKDAINGIVWKDDSQVVAVTMMKRYGAYPCAWVRVRPALEE